MCWWFIYKKKTLIFSWRSWKGLDICHWLDIKLCQDINLPVSKLSWQTLSARTSYTWNHPTIQQSLVFSMPSVPLTLSHIWKQCLEDLKTYNFSSWLRLDIGEEWKEHGVCSTLDSNPRSKQNICTVLSRCSKLAALTATFNRLRCTLFCCCKCGYNNTDIVY